MELLTTDEVLELGGTAVRPMDDVVSLEALHPVRPPLWSLERWCEVRDLASDLAITKMEDVDGVPYAPVRVADPEFANVVVAGTGDLEDGPARSCDPSVLAARYAMGFNVGSPAG